jgi:hypothetical protein
MVSFYSFLDRGKQGRSCIRLSKTPISFMKSAPAVAQAFEQTLGLSIGETSPDGMFTLEWTSDIDPVAPDLLIVVNHHGTKILHADVMSDDAADDRITLYDPHPNLHHLEPKDWLREKGPHAPKESAYYDRIAAAALGGRIVVTGHGGDETSADHLTEYLRARHPDTYKPVVAETVSDLPDITTQQLLKIARKAFRQ